MIENNRISKKLIHMHLFLIIYIMSNTLFRIYITTIQIALLHFIIIFKIKITEYEKQTSQKKIVNLFKVLRFLFFRK